MKRTLITTLLLLVLSSFSFAQGLGFHGIAPKVSVLIPAEDGMELGFAFGAVADLGEVSDGLGLFPIFSYELPGSEFSGVDISNVQLGADVHYSLNKDAYVGGGLSLNFFSTEVDLGPFGKADASETEIGFSALGGYNFPLGGMDAAVEGRFDVVSNYNHLEVALLVWFPMGK